MTRSAWILGAGGLLGSSLARVLREDGTDLFEPKARLCWGDPAVFAERIRPLVQQFATRAERSARWMLLWAAGQGTMGSSSERMVRETHLLRSLLDALAKVPALRTRPGSLFFASTAGAVYAGSEDDTVTERSTPAPRAPYGVEKLAQEHLVADWQRTMGETSVLIGRISTLYGCGQGQSKSQGLISHIARCVIRDRPIHVFVPLDTIRDYLHVTDAARDIACHLKELERHYDVTTKIVAEEASTTIAQIIGRFEQVTHRKPLIVTSATRLGEQYLRRICFRSVVPPLAKAIHRTSLLVGISEVMAHERLSFARGPAE
jgi:UDP-glucose 4-epimerase